MSRMMAFVSASSKLGMSFTKSAAGLGRPSVCGKSLPKEEAVDADGVLEHRHVVLVVRRDPHVLAELVDRMGLERVRHLAAGVLEVAEEVGHPHGAVLDRRQLEAREALEHTVADDRGEGVADAAVGEGDEREGGVLEALEATPAAGVGGLPERPVLAHAAEAGVEREGHARLGDQAPDLVELGVAG